MRTRELNISAEGFGDTFWATKPIRFKFWFINFHLYRRPYALGMKSLAQKGQVTWEEWERRIKKVCPIQFLVRDTARNIRYDIEHFFSMKIRFKIRELIKRFTNPDNVIKIKTLDVYAFKGDVILHSMFQILTDFVESHPEKHYNMNSDPRLSYWWGQVNALYRYWKVERKQIEQKIEEECEKVLDSYNSTHDEIPYETKYAKVLALERALIEKDTAALEFIVRTRDEFRM